MFVNFQYLSNENYGKDFACIYTDERGVQWHVWGQRKAGESDFDCIVTLRSQESNPDPVLRVKGMDGIHVLMEIATAVFRWNTREIEVNNE